MAIAGLLVASAAVVAAIAFNFPFWYTPFTIGSFLLFDRLSERFGAPSLLRMLARGSWRPGVTMYLAAILIAFVVDVIYGRMLGGAWVYPPWHGVLNIAVPILFHYPFGFLSLYATFRTIRGVTEGRRTPRAPGPFEYAAQGAETKREAKQRDAGTRRHGDTGPSGSGDSAEAERAQAARRRPFPAQRYGRLSLLALVLALSAPLVNLWLNANRNASEVLLVVMLVGTIAVDGVREALTGDSLLREIYARGLTDAVAIVVTLAWAILINEGPNVFAREWVYSPAPFGLPLWVMLMLGWPFLLTVSAAVYETIMALTSRDLVYTDSPK